MTPPKTSRICPSPSFISPRTPQTNHRTVATTYPSYLISQASSTSPHHRPHQFPPMPPLPFLLLLLLLLLPITSTLSRSPHKLRPPPLDLIHRTCSATTYADLCISSLQSDPTAPAAPSAKALTAILLKLAAANASDTSSYLSSLAGAARGERTKWVLSGCADRYSDASEALRWSSGEVEEESYDYAYLHVRAATAYPVMCRDMYRVKGLACSADVRRKEVGLVRLCTVGMQMIVRLA